MTTLVASPAGRPSPPVTGPTLLVPWRLPFYLAEPAAGLHVGERKRKNHGRADPALRCDAGMRGAAENLDLPAIRADGADGDVGGGAAVVVEGHDRRAEITGLDVARTP